MRAIDSDVRNLFSQDGRFTRWLRVEAALADAQAELGAIPKKAAEGIAGYFAPAGGGPRRRGGRRPPPPPPPMWKSWR